MLPSIVDASGSLSAFVAELGLALSAPQRRHLIGVADALLVCETEKTLAGLQRQFVEAVDPSNLADFFRISPWSAEAVRQRLQAFAVAWAVARAPAGPAPPAIRISLDDSIAEQDTATRHLEPVEWHS